MKTCAEFAVFHEGDEQVTATCDMVIEHSDFAGRESHHDPALGWWDKQAGLHERANHPGYAGTL